MKGNPIKFIKHKDVDIMYIDYRVTENTKEMIQVLEESLRMCRENKPICIISNYNEVPVPNSFVDRGFQLLKEFRKCHPRSAIVGNQHRLGITIKIQNTLGDNTVRLFYHESEALDWLKETTKEEYDAIRNNKKKFSLFGLVVKLFSKGE